MGRHLAIVCSLVLLGCGGTPYYGASHSNSFVSPSEEPTASSREAQLIQDCERAIVLSCDVLAIKYEEGDIGDSIPKNANLALRYRIKACLLGSGGSCHAAGEAYLDGVGTTADQPTAISYFTRSCEDTNIADNPMIGFSCWRLATTMLQQDYWNNYDSAMALLDRACLRSSTLCDAKEPFEGSGRAAEKSPPQGAVNFIFGMTSAEVYEVCNSHKGTPGSGVFSNEILCRSPFLDILGKSTQYIALPLCNGTLCAITISFQTTKNRHFHELVELKKQLEDLYGSPSVISQKMSLPCRKGKTVADLAKCLRSDEAEFFTSWYWPDRASVSLILLGESSGDIVIQVLYKNAEALKALRSSGL